MSAAQDFIAAVRALGEAGPDAATTLIDAGCVGLHATPVGNVVITKLFVSQDARNLGHGSRILRMCTSQADRHQVTLRLMPIPFNRLPGGMTARKLSAWFARHGFEPQDAAGRMVRRAQPVVEAA